MGFRLRKVNRSLRSYITRTQPKIRLYNFQFMMSATCFALHLDEKSENPEQTRTIIRLGHYKRGVEDMERFLRELCEILRYVKTEIDLFQVEYGYDCFKNNKMFERLGIKLRRRKQQLKVASVTLRHADMLPFKIILPIMKPESLKKIKFKYFGGNGRIRFGGNGRVQNYVSPQAFAVSELDQWKKADKLEIDEAYILESILLFCSISTACCCLYSVPAGDLIQQKESFIGDSTKNKFTIYYKVFPEEEFFVTTVGPWIVSKLNTMDVYYRTEIRDEVVVIRRLPRYGSLIFARVNRSDVPLASIIKY
ncbi:Protein CBG28140 [Caenorhabditis briggsae]|uniref:Protein CBG28140 n=1 Tax=Caenorhabditis briggsae TaxID=6238 RepID=B6IHY0_CAEBR|nr:Protein CBG28140 [Caenorhabditis briggsae]CAR99510.1 Protein CBG28140 [Caenorhabditis briggsae]